MNRARSTFMRKGYWLTAFAAIALLAASPWTASAQVTITAPDVVEGGIATITVTGKASIPAGTAATTVTLTVVAASDTGGNNDTESDVSQNLGIIASLKFPANNATGATEAITSTQSGTVIVQTHHDTDAEDETIGLTYGASLGNVGALMNAVGGEPLSRDANDVDTSPASFEIEDDETQTYVLDVDTDDPKEDAAIAVILKADPAHVDDFLVLTLHSSNGKYTLLTNTATIGRTGDVTTTFMLTPPNPDGNRVEDSVTLTAYSGEIGKATEQASVTIKVADANTLPAVAMMVVDEDGEVADPQPTSVTEGTSIYVAVMPLDKDGEDVEAFDAEKLTVALTATGTADSADYTLVRTIEITAGQKASDPVELEVRSDEDVGMESLMFDAVVSGDSKIGPETSTSMGVLSLYIADATTPQITPKSSEADYDRIKAATADLNPGETVELMTSDLFTVDDGFSAGYSVSVEGDSVSAFASGEVVTINAEMAGESKITVTGTASMSTSSLMPSQTVSNVASLTFPVMVVDTTLVVTVSADPMEVEAGGTSTLTATANRAVTAGDGAVTIELTVVGDGTVDPASITIAMGAMSGSTMLTANEKVTVVATGSGITAPMQVTVDVTEAPEPVPALPLLGQLLLGLGLLGGGVRHLYRRRQG